MDTKRRRIALATSTLSLLLCVSCGSDGSLDQPLPSSESEGARGTIDPATVQRGLESAQAALDIGATPDLPELSLDVREASEKIRAGTAIHAGHVLGNAVVLIINEGGMICTAQVINRWFLLTAAHCAREMFPNGWAAVLIGYTTTTGPSWVHATNVHTLIDPNYSPGDRDEDVALLFLNAPMATCHGTLLACSPDTPNNAMFQFFLPNEPKFTRTSYAIVGYGDDANENPGSTMLRAGVMTWSSSNFSDGVKGFKTVVSWNAAHKARPCYGDSGGPLVITGFNRLLHLGVLSGGSNILTCDQASGEVSYSGLSQVQYNWAMGLILAIRDVFQLPFDCAAMTHATAGLYTFHCDNDGSLY